MSGPAFAAHRDAVMTVLERALGRRVRIDAIRPLAGGVCHQSYRIGTDAGPFAVKLRRPGAADVLGVTAELDVAHRVATAGLGPVPLAADADAGLIVTHYIEGSRPLTPADIGAGAMPEKIAALLCALHRVPVDGMARFDASRHARRYIDAVRGGGSLTATGAARAVELLDLAAGFDARPTPPVLCHCDLVADNVLATDRLWLIDFEYAAAADPVLDLASLAAMNDLDAKCRARLIDAYRGYAATAFDAADFDKVVRLLDLLAWFWAAAQARIGGHRRGLAAWLRREPPLTDKDTE